MKLITRMSKNVGSGTAMFWWQGMEMDEFLKNSVGESTKMMDTVRPLPGQVLAQAHRHDEAS